MKSWHSRHSCLANIPFWKKSTALSGRTGGAVCGRNPRTVPITVRIRQTCASEMRNLRKGIPYPPVFTRSGLRMSFCETRMSLQQRINRRLSFSETEITNWRRMSTKKPWESGSASSIKPAETSGRPASWKHSGCRRNATARQK